MSATNVQQMFIYFRKPSRILAAYFQWHEDKMDICNWHTKIIKCPQELAKCKAYHSNQCTETLEVTFRRNSKEYTLMKSPATQTQKASTAK